MKKALCELKQSPRAWFGRFTNVMLSLGFKQSQGDHTLFIKHSDSGGVSTLLVYVDDIIMIGNDPKEKETLQQCLAKEFKIKDLGKLKYILGIEVAQSKEGIYVSQHKYILDLLKKTRKLGCKLVETLIEANHKLEEALENKGVDPGMYQRLVGQLIYLSHTRSNIVYVVSVVSQFMHNLKEVYLQVVFRILKHLKGILGMEILF